MGAGLRPPALAVAALAVASVAVGLVLVWQELGRQHREYAGWSDYRIAHAGAVHERVDPTLFDAMRRAVPAGARYHLELEEATPLEELVARTFATYWLLPSTPATAKAADGTLFVQGHTVRWLPRAR